MKKWMLVMLLFFAFCAHAEYADVDVIGGLCVQNHMLGPEVDLFDLEGRYVLIAPGGGWCNEDFYRYISTDPRLLIIVSHFHKYHCLERSLVNMYGYTTPGFSQTPVYDSVYPIGVENTVGVGDGYPVLINPLGKVRLYKERIPQHSDVAFAEWQDEIVKDALPYVKGTLLMAPAPKAFPKLREELIAGTNVEKRLAEVREKAGIPDVDAALKSIDEWFVRQRTMIEIEAGFPPEGWYPRRECSLHPGALEYCFGSRVDEHGTLLATAVRRYERLKATSPTEAEKVCEEVKQYLASEQCRSALKANRALMDLHREVEAYGYCGKNGWETKSSGNRLKWWTKIGITWDRGFCVSKELEERYEAIKAQLRETSPSSGWIHKVNPEGETLAITCRSTRWITERIRGAKHLGGPEVDFQNLGSQVVVICGKDEKRFSQMPRDDLSYYFQPQEFRDPAWNRRIFVYTGKSWRLSPSGRHTNNLDLWFDLLTGKEIFGEMPSTFWQWRFLDPYMTERMQAFACKGVPGRGKALTLVLVPRTTNTLLVDIAKHFDKNPHVKVIVSLTHGSDAHLPADATYTNLVYCNCDADFAFLYDQEGRLVFAMSGVQCNLEEMNHLIPSVEYWVKRMKADKIDTEDERIRWGEYQAWKVRHLIQMDPPSAIFAYQVLKKRMPEMAAEYTETIEQLMNDPEVCFWRDFRKQVYRAHRTKNGRQLAQLGAKLEKKLPEITSLPLRITANSLQQDIERFAADLEGPNVQEAPKKRSNRYDYEDMGSQSTQKSQRASSRNRGSKRRR